MTYDYATLPRLFPWIAMWINLKLQIRNQHKVQNFREESIQAETGYILNFHKLLLVCKSLPKFEYVKKTLSQPCKAEEQVENLSGSPL